MAAHPQAGHHGAVGGCCFLRGEVSHFVQGMIRASHMASPFFLPVSSCQCRPSTPGFCSQVSWAFLWLPRPEGPRPPTLLSVAHSPPALAAPASLHICLFRGCSLSTRERREMFQTVSGQGCPGRTEKASVLGLSEGSHTSATASFWMGPEACYTPQGHQGWGWGRLGDL